jgi:hypothetical protein
MFICIFLLVSGSLAAQSTYRIGDKGPAGGYIFFDKGNNFGGWRYLEAAPGDFVDRVEWGLMSVAVEGTASELGAGKQNTQHLVQLLDEYREMDRAAQYCVRLNYNGFNDWFLPSIAELNLMYQNLYSVIGVGFRADWYWSSSQFGAYGAWGLNFSDGAQYGNLAKTNTCFVRAIRTF